VHVLCSGIRYGNGERTFYDHFQKAWIQNPEQLQVVGGGRNRVPTIHIIDLARIVRRVVCEGSPLQYIFAIDRTKRPTQTRITKAVAKGMGTGKMQKYEEADPSWSSWDQFLTINLKMRTSDAFKDGEVDGELAAAMEEEELEEAQNAAKFPWHAEEGILGNIRKLNEEFNHYRGLNPVKIFVTGPPASGKTFYSEKVAKYYNIPRVHVGQLWEEALRLADLEEGDPGFDEEDEFATSVREAIGALREAEKERLEEAQGEPPEDMEDGWPAIDPKDRDLVKIRLKTPEKILFKLLQD